MKKFLLVFAIPLLFWYVFWDWQDVINQEEQKVVDEKVKILNKKFKLEKFTTQDNFEKIILDKIYEKILDYCSNKIYPVPLYRINWWVKSMSLLSTKAENISQKVFYWKTNLQKKNVDEPEILKLTRDYIAYFNKQNGKIYVISSPVSWNSLKLDKVKISDVIKVPSVIRKYSVRLFFVNNQLIVIWTRYSQAFGGYVTDLVFYKIKNWKAKFNRLYDVKWNFFDARIVNNKIYLITDYNFLPIVRKICDNYFYFPLKEKASAIKKKYYEEISKEDKKPFAERDLKKIRDLYKSMWKELTNLYKAQINHISKDEILKYLSEAINQKNIDIFVDKNSKLKINWKIYPLNFRLVNAALNNILFIPTNFDDFNIWSLKFNLVNIIDLDTKQNPNQYVIFWNISNGQIHMTTKSLYLVNNYYEPFPWRCRPWLLCILPIYPRWNFTLIHKLTISWFNLNYVNSQIIPWKPINQYSMDEDSNWNFRIFTKYYFPQRQTDLYTFDKNLKLQWKLRWIAPWEEFKSSRFIGDKAFLITFKATDPLFVIDLKDNKNPKIIWELKIPGYSLYLHPLYKSWNVQYLLWIWQQAKEIYWNRSLPKNIKLDVYKINYSKTVWEVCWKKHGNDLIKCLKSAGVTIDYICSNDEWNCQSDEKNILDVASKDKNWKNIYVERLFSLVLWNEKKAGNWWSYTPVFDNPRTFVLVWDQIRSQMRLDETMKPDEVRWEDQMISDENDKILLLPVYLAEDKIETKCYPKYVWEDWRRYINWEKCYDNVKKIPYFVWIKWIKINLLSWFKEVLSKNYISLYKEVSKIKDKRNPYFYKNWLSKWQYKNENHRVSYYKIWEKLLPFEINVNFFDMFNKSKDKFIPFNYWFEQIRK